MDIVDAQIHIGPGGIDEVLSAMNALGIRAALVDEYWLRNFNNEPNHPVPNGATRPVAPTAELAAQLHPERFSWLLRIHRADPEYAAIIRQVRDAPGGRALRLDPGLSPDEMRRFATGEYDHICAAAADSGLPLFVFAPDNPEAFARCAGKFPDLRIIVDHCGLFSNSMRATIGGGVPAKNEIEQLAMFDQVLALADFPNVALKWGHSSAMFDTPAWPGKQLQPVLRRAVSRFGAERIMWASDFSVNQRGESWGELLFGQRANEDLSQSEMAWVLGGSLRQWLGWPA